MLTNQTLAGCPHCSDSHRQHTDPLGQAEKRRGVVWAAELGLPQVQWVLVDAREKAHGAYHFLQERPPLPKLRECTAVAVPHPFPPSLFRSTVQTIRRHLQSERLGPPSSQMLLLLHVGALLLRTLAERTNNLAVP